MIQLTPGTKIYICIESADFRKGIDGLKNICKVKLRLNPFSGAVFIFRNKRKNSIKILVYDGQGYWLLQKRLSQGTFKWWPSSASEICSLSMYELQIFIGNGDPDRANIANEWKKVI